MDLISVFQCISIGRYFRISRVVVTEKHNANMFMLQGHSMQLRSKGRRGGRRCWRLGRGVRIKLFVRNSAESIVPCSKFLYEESETIDGSD